MAFPNLRAYPQSGLNFPWADLQEGDISLGQDGPALALTIIIQWEDILTAFQQILGYSYRDGNRLRRVLPWRHPFMNQLSAQQITSVRGIRREGNNINFPKINLWTIGAKAGADDLGNAGPYSQFHYVALTVRFWRPPYSLRTDNDILDNDGNPQEWKRFTEITWEPESEILQREGMQFEYMPGQNPPVSTFPGSIGQPLAKPDVFVRWYEIPENFIFKRNNEGVPNGAPDNLIYTRTQTNNPLTGYIYPVGSPIFNCVNSPIGGATIDLEEKRFLGFKIGTLLYLGPKIIKRPVHLPPALMRIPVLPSGVPVSQNQYDILHQFKFFDPKNPVGYPYTGHNLMPYAGDGLWYGVQSQIQIDGKNLTPHNYADFSDLFKAVI